MQHGSIYTEEQEEEEEQDMEAGVVEEEEEDEADEEEEEEEEEEDGGEESVKSVELVIRNSPSPPPPPPPLPHQPQIFYTKPTFAESNTTHRKPKPIKAVKHTKRHVQPSKSFFEANSRFMWWFALLSIAMFMFTMVAVVIWETMYLAPMFNYISLTTKNLEQHGLQANLQIFAPTAP